LSKAVSEGRALYRLRLFIAGTAPRSRGTVETVRRFCEVHLAGRHELEIVDIFQQASLAERDGVIAAPTLLKLAPGPERRITGSLNEARLLQGLDVPMNPETHP
jgi:circadian clock protein KaiB